MCLCVPVCACVCLCVPMCDSEAAIRRLTHYVCTKLAPGRCVRSAPVLTATAIEERDLLQVEHEGAWQLVSAAVVLQAIILLVVVADIHTISVLKDTIAKKTLKITRLLEKKRSLKVR